jgi:hypothetical protein
LHGAGQGPNFAAGGVKRGIEAGDQTTRRAASKTPTAAIMMTVEVASAVAVSSRKNLLMLFMSSSSLNFPLLNFKIHRMDLPILLWQPTKESSHFGIALEFLSGPVFLYAD